MPASRLMPYQVSEVVPGVGFREVAVGVARRPRPARHAGVIPRRHRRIHSELGHHPAADVLVIEVAADPQLLHLELVRAARIGRADQRVILWLRDVVDVIAVEDELTREVLGRQREFGLPAIAVQPGEVREREGVFGGNASGVKSNVRISSSRFMWWCLQIPAS